jgi:hypothetical protein
MEITTVKYYKDHLSTKNEGIIMVVDGVTSFVPINLENTDYAEIMEQVDAGELTIEPA